LGTGYATPRRSDGDFRLPVPGIARPRNSSRNGWAFLLLDCAILASMSDQQATQVLFQLTRIADSLDKFAKFLEAVQYGRITFPTQEKKTQH
jgi:hypothetical protein